jgi:hypothetical protein
LIGIPERTLREARPVAVAGHSAWTQTFDARIDGRTIRAKTVTLVAAGCAYDFVLVAEGEFEPSEQVFDAWVAGFTLAGADTAGGPP